MYQRRNFKQNKVVIRIHLHTIALFVHKHTHTHTKPPKADQSRLSHLTYQVGTCLSATSFSLAGNSGHKLRYGLQGEELLLCIEHNLTLIKV